MNKRLLSLSLSSFRDMSGSPKTDLKECPLESDSGQNWNIETRESVENSKTDFVKAELFRRLAGDADLRSEAFFAHGDQERGLAARSGS
jgi:hypothetical protein